MTCRTWNRSTSSKPFQRLLNWSLNGFAAVPSGGDPEEEEVDAAPLYGPHPSPPPSPPSPPVTHTPLGQPPSRAALRLALPQNPNQQVVVSRRGRGLARLDSPPPINRYAGDWSVCGRDFLSGQDADYDEVAGSGSEEGVFFFRMKALSNLKKCLE